MPGISQTLHCVKRSVSFPLFPFPVDVLLVLLVDAFDVTGVVFEVKDGTGGGGSLGSGGGDVISVLVDVATNICGLDSDATSPSGLGIGFIYLIKNNEIYLNMLK